MLTNENPTPRGQSLLTIEQLCKNLQLKKQTVYALIWKGKIPCVKLSRRCVRFQPSAIDAWLAEKSSPAGPQSPTEQPPPKPKKKKSKAIENISAGRVQSIVDRAKKEVLR